MRDWFWQLQAAGNGPDWMFWAAVPAGEAALLGGLVRQHPLPGFARYQVVDGWCSCHGHVATYDLYADTRTFPQLVQHLRGQTARNVWMYHTIAVCGGDITIERGYGGYPQEHGATETALLALVGSKFARLDWHVSYGGEGYGAGEVASGQTGKALLEYLQA